MFNKIILHVDLNNFYASVERYWIPNCVESPLQFVGILTKDTALF